jgi:hypothetical protein
VIILSVTVLLVTGVALLAMGPGNGPVRSLHQLSFIVLFGAMCVHVLAHLRKLPALTAGDWRPRTRLQGGSARRAVLLTCLLTGLALGAVAITYDGAWVHRAHHHLPQDGAH